MKIRHARALAVVGLLLVSALSLPVIGTAAAAPARPASAGDRCTIVGTGRPDVLVGTSRRDVICGLGGSDIIRGGGGDDLIRGGAGADGLVGGTGSDTLVGGAGDDDLSGGGQGDDLEGGGGDDEVVSGGGADDVDGGAGDNLCIVDAADESVRCRYDEEPPVAVETVLSPVTVDVTDADAEITVRVHATDDTGVIRITGGLADRNNGVSLEVGPMYLVSGTDRDGWWEGSVTVPRWTPPGTLYPDLWITDRHWQSVDARNAGSVRVIDTDPDVEVPRLSVRQLTPAAIDVRNGSREVTVTVRAQDAKSGVERVDICLGRPGTPDKYNAHPLFQSVACEDGVARSGGNRHDGTWTTTLTIPRGSVGATYNVTAYVEDRVSNRAYWDGPEAHQQYVDGRWCCTPNYAFADGSGRLEVTGSVADATPAWVDAVTVSTTELDTLTTNAVTHVRVHAVDAAGEGEGVVQVMALLVSDRSLASDPQFDRTYFELDEGTITDGWWEGDVVAPRGTPPGRYHLLVGISDRAHSWIFTDPEADGADGVSYQPLVGIPTITVVDSRP